MWKDCNYNEAKLREFDPYTLLHSNEHLDLDRWSSIVLGAIGKEDHKKGIRFDCRKMSSDVDGFFSAVQKRKFSALVAIQILDQHACQGNHVK